MSVHTPNYIGNSDYIINPTPQQIEQYKYVPPPPTEKELALIELEETDKSTIRIIDDIIDYIINDTPIPQAAIDKINRRKFLRTKI